MSESNKTKLQNNIKSGRPQVTSYDSGYEHSIEHWFETRLLVELEDDAIEFGVSRARAASA